MTASPGQATADNRDSHRSSVGVRAYARPDGACSDSAVQQTRGDCRSRPNSALRPRRTAPAARRSHSRWLSDKPQVVGAITPDATHSDLKMGRHPQSGGRFKITMSHSMRFARIYPTTTRRAIVPSSPELAMSRITGAGDPVRVLCRDRHRAAEPPWRSLRRSCTITACHRMAPMDRPNPELPSACALDQAAACPPERLIAGAKHGIAHQIEGQLASCSGNVEALLPETTDLLSPGQA